MSFNYKRIIPHKWFRTLPILTFGLIILGSGTAFVVADCHIQTDKPVDPNLCNSIIGGAGNNEITVDKNQTVTGPFFGDGGLGNGGNDTLINNGITVSNGGSTGRNGDIEGDVSTGNGGDDVIVNNGTVAGDMDGDTVLGNGGNDVLINNGKVGDDMDGDNARVNGGDDLIINNGTVGGDIQADDNEDTANSQGGNDTIVINGTVEGSVDGDAGVVKGGDDVVILQNGANGGADHELYMNGNDGDDTLTFNFVVPDQATLDSLSERIASVNPARGSLEYNGQTFTWEGFEQVSNQLLLLNSFTYKTIKADNQTRALIYSGGGPMAGFYCIVGDMAVMGSDPQLKSEFLFRVKAKVLASAIQTVKASTEITNVKIVEANKQALYVFPSGDLHLWDVAERYNFGLIGNPCAR